MPSDLNGTTAFDLALQAERFYAALIPAAGSDPSQTWAVNCSMPASSIEKAAR